MNGKKQRKARCTSRKVTVQTTAQGLTSQAGLLPVITFLEKFNLENLIRRHVKLERGDSAVYQLVDVILLTTLGLIAGARSLRAVTFVWADPVLRKIGGWFRIPDDSNLGRIFKSITGGTVAQMETLNHVLRGRIWKKALQAGALRVDVHVPACGLMPTPR